MLEPKRESIPTAFYIPAALLDESESLVDLQINTMPLLLLWIYDAYYVHGSHWLMQSSSAFFWLAAKLVFNYSFVHTLSSMRFFLNVKIINFLNFDVLNYCYRCAISNRIKIINIHPAMSFDSHQLVFQFASLSLSHCDDTCIILLRTSLWGGGGLFKKYQQWFSINLLVLLFIIAH